MKKMLFLAVVFGGLLFEGGSNSAYANSVDETSLNFPKMINVEDSYERSANFTKTITVGSYAQYKSTTFDVNKVFGTDHNTIYVKFTPTQMSGKYTLRLFKNGSVVRALTVTNGSSPGVINLENCTNPDDLYHVTVNNDVEKTLTGTLYVNTRIN